MGPRPRCSKLRGAPSPVQGVTKAALASEERVQNLRPAQVRLLAVRSRFQCQTLSSRRCSPCKHLARRSAASRTGTSSASRECDPPPTTPRCGIPIWFGGALGLLCSGAAPPPG